MLESPHCRAKDCLAHSEGGYFCKRHFRMLSQETRLELTGLPSAEVMTLALKEIADYIPKSTIKQHFREQAAQLKDSLREGQIDIEGVTYDVMVSVIKRDVKSSKLWKHVTFKRADNLQWTSVDVDWVSRTLFDLWQRPLIDVQPGVKVLVACSLWAPAEQEVVLQ